MEDVKKQNTNLDVRESSSSKAIRAMILKQSMYLNAPILTNSIIHFFIESKSLGELK